MDYLGFCSVFSPCISNKHHSHTHYLHTCLMQIKLLKRIENPIPPSCWQEFLIKYSVQQMLQNASCNVLLLIQNLNLLSMRVRETTILQSQISARFREKIIPPTQVSLTVRERIGSMKRQLQQLKVVRLVTKIQPSPQREWNTRNTSSSTGRFCLSPTVQASVWRAKRGTIVSVNPSQQVVINLF